MTTERHPAQPDVPSIDPKEELLRRVPPTFYPDPEQPRKPQWHAFRPNQHDTDGVSVGRRQLVASLEAFSYTPDGSKRRNVAQFRAAHVQELGLTVEPRPLPDDRSHAVIPEMNIRDYESGGERKLAIKEWALKLAHEHAQMVLVLDEPDSGESISL